MGFLNRVAEKAVRSEGHESLAAERGLTYSTIGTVPDSATPLLRAARGKQFSNVMEGALGESIQGHAANMTHRVTTRRGGETDTVTKFCQIVLAGAPAAADFIPTLVVGSRAGLEPLHDEGLREISTESTAVTKKHRIWIGEDTSENRVRQLLSPVMIDWLASVDVPGFAFELDRGWLCAHAPPSVYVPFSMPGKPEELGWLIDTADGLAKRVMAEVNESAGAAPEPAAGV